MTAAEGDRLRDAVNVMLQQWSLLHPVMTLRQLEWEHIQRVLLEHGGNVSAAARALELHRRSLQRKLLNRPPAPRE